MALDRPATEEAIANLALDRCKEDEIASFDDDLNRARVVRRHFGAVRDALLRRFDWNFASTWVAPAASATATHGEWQYVYPLPSDCLAVREVRDLQEDEWEVTTLRMTDSVGADVEALVLATDDASPDVRYTRKVAAVRLWDATFADAFVCQLAARCCPNLGKSIAMARAFTAEAEDLLTPAAARADSQEKAKSKVAHQGVTSWLAARAGFRRPGY